MLHQDEMGGQEETPGKTQKTLERLSQLIWEQLGVILEELKEAAVDERDLLI